MKVPRLLARAAAAAVLAASGLHAARPQSDVRRIAAPDLSSPLVEEYPSPSEPREPVKAAVFQRINRDRAAHGLASVAWDEKAARVADLFCAQQVREESRGHFLTDGVPPYARMGFAGVFGLVSENSASAVATSAWSEESYQGLAVSAHKRMMQERPPDDGHRRAILEPDATHVGVGYAARGGRFQMAEEFSVRKLDWLSVSRSAGQVPAVAFEGRVRSPDRIQFVTIAREPAPRKLTSEEANSRTSYAYPTPAEAYVPEGQRRMVIVGAATQDRLRLRRDRAFAFTYEPASPGLFTFVFYVANRDGERAREAGSATVLFL